MRFKLVLRALQKGLIWYCVYFTVVVYLVSLFPSIFSGFTFPSEMRLPSVLLQLWMIILFTFAEYNGLVKQLPPNKGTYDYQNGKLVFKKDDENQNQA